MCAYDGLDRSPLSPFAPFDVAPYASVHRNGDGSGVGAGWRIAFARVMLNPTSIVLLDEPTAKLDSLSKEYIIAALKILKSQRIVVIASHDPLLIDMSDIHINLNLSKVDA